MLQSVNGVGLVGLNDNYADYFSVAAAGATRSASHLSLAAAPTDGVFDATVALSATLTSDAGPLAGRPVVFTLGGVNTIGTTGLDGVASVNFQLTPTPGPYSLRADYAGNATYADSSGLASVHDPHPDAGPRPRSVRAAASHLRQRAVQCRGLRLEDRRRRRWRHLCAREWEPRLLSDAFRSRHDHGCHHDPEPVHHHLLDRGDRAVRRRGPGRRFLRHRQGRPGPHIHVDRGAGAAFGGTYVPTATGAGRAAR